MTTRTPIPLRPDYGAVRQRATDLLIRMAVAKTVATIRNTNVMTVVNENWPEMLRSATDPATIGSATWAGALATHAVSAAVVGLAPRSASAALIAAGMSVSLAGRGSVGVPGCIVAASDAGGFVGEGQPIQVRAPSLAGPTLVASKLGVISVFTQEMANASVTDFEGIVRQILGEASALALDAAIFSATAASEIRPAGLLVGVTAIGATAGGGQNAISKDVGNLIDALTLGRNVVFVASKAQAAALKIWAGPKFDYPVLTSSALAAGTIIAVDADAFVSGFGSAPEFDVKSAPVFHMEDATPLAIGTPGSPATVASPARSLWQTDSIGLRMILRCSFAMRAPGSVAMIDAATW
jgi:hypothetical protein